MSGKQTSGRMCLLIYNTIYKNIMRCREPPLINEPRKKKGRPDCSGLLIVPIVQPRCDPQIGLPPSVNSRDQPGPPTNWLVPPW